MQHEITATYTEQLVKRIARKRFFAMFWLHQICCSVVFLAGLFLVISFPNDWVSGLLLGFGSTMVLLHIRTYMYTQKSAKEYLKELGQPAEIKWTFTDKYVGRQYGLGTCETPWEKFIVLQRDKEAWLLFLYNMQYFILPENLLDEDTKDLIQDKVAESGGKVS